MNPTILRKNVILHSFDFSHLSNIDSDKVSHLREVCAQFAKLRDKSVLQGNKSFLNPVLNWLSAQNISKVEHLADILIKLLNKKFC